ncbi:MAG: hypothetical protein OES90_01585 [Xanthomonadales bacterium]|nr:hypothetical protein [Xanthomonadales bacterium]
MNSLAIQRLTDKFLREGVTEFDVVENDQRLNRLTDNILGDDWYSDYSMVMFSGQGTKRQSWHQDCHLMIRVSSI